MPRNRMSGGRQKRGETILGSFTWSGMRAADPRIQVSGLTLISQKRKVPRRFPRRLIVSDNRPIFII